ncbi:hypothetical protein B0H11DRAFT_2057580 [Mycena galericulata]|nr:hypothetical protein B0H11DRAFT_2057580 [Mycena galericulata]
MTTNCNAEMLPRRYQEEVFERAQRGNVIAALDTGAGKTFISLLLLKWIAALQPRSKMIFLVPKVALVEQQGEFVASHSTLRVLKLYGALDIDLTDRRGWLNKFEHHDVFVMTPQIFLNFINHSLWSIDKVALIIFDEAHHAKKNHPYNAIMREYFEVSYVSRPKIFGMTASPIWNVKDPALSLAAFEANMDSKVVAVRNHVDELSTHAPKAEESVENYPSPPAEYDFPSPTLWMCLSAFEAAFGHLNIPWDVIERRYTSTLLNLGPYCASMYLYLEISHRVCHFLKIEKTEGQLDDCVAQMRSLSLISADIVEIQAILAGYQDFFVPSLPICLEWCSPKIGVLVDILLSHKSTTFQGIIFVEQRQVAICLAKVLPCIPALSETIRCAELVGEGDNVQGVSVNTGQTTQSKVQSFRDGKINLIITTSVAEEGLDFPTCDLVIRFDALQHMIGYVQSRGRARSKAASKFIVMVEHNDLAQLKRYQEFAKQEPELKALYQSRQDGAQMDEEDEEDGQLRPTDLAHRERYVAPSTGAILTYSNAISLLDRLCALIPHDAFTPPHVPKYSGDFQATVQLPSSLPLPQPELRYEGPRRASKHEAKCAVAFMAVRRLHELDIFDRYLLPVSTTRKGHEENDGTPLLDVSEIPNVMQVLVKDPWTIDWSQKLWIHSIFIDGRRVAGLVTGTNLFPVEVDGRVRTSSGELVRFDEDHEVEQHELMHNFTKLGIWFRITATPIELPLNLYVVPVLETGQPDFPAIRRLIAFPRGDSNWDGIDDTDYDHLMVTNVNLTGHIYLLQRIRSDLSPSSVPLDNSQEAGFAKYRDYWVQKWTGKPGSRKRPPQIPENGPLLELRPFPRSNGYGVYTSDLAHYPGAPFDDTSMFPPPAAMSHVLFPRDCCRWISISEDVREALHVLPTLFHKITSMYRARRARLSLSLPPILDDILVEALTLPCSCAGYSNQRLETLGDAVLQLCTTVHLFNRYPNKHEGQLALMRENAVSNRFLLSKAKEIGLESFLTCENLGLKTWRCNIQWSVDGDVRHARREFPRRSLQDCMESTLGASFVTGGIEMALHTGRSLGLDFGGPTPWGIRYSIHEASPVSSMFAALEESLGYSFRCGLLLVEALTHPSFDNRTTNSYQRLEFLGDAILDLVVIDYLYRKFPLSTSDQLAWPRTRAICAPALASVGVRRLQLHQLMFVNNVELSMEVDRYVPRLEACSGEEIVQRGWRYDPPKVLSDLFESVIGAVLVDSNYDYERTAAVVEYVMEEVLEALTPSVPRDPITVLMEWAGSAGCISSKHIIFKKATSQGGGSTVTTLVHGVVVAGPIVSASPAVAKNLSAEEALSQLRDPANKKSLSRLCDCRNKRASSLEKQDRVPGP